jgi:ribosomal protein L15
MTGRAAGYCAGFGMPGYANPIAGRGFGMGFGRGRGFGGRGGGRGWRHMFYATGVPGWARFGWGGIAPVAAPTPEVEKDFLEGQVEALQAQLDEVRKRLDELAAQETRKAQ